MGLLGLPNPVLASKMTTEEDTAPNLAGILGEIRYRTHIINLLAFDSCVVEGYRIHTCHVVPAAAANAPVPATISPRLFRARDSRRPSTALLAWPESGAAMATLR